MRAAVYNRYWHSMGGGERYSAGLGATLAVDGWDVDLLGHTEEDLDSLGRYLGLDLSGVRMRVVPDRGEPDLSRVTAEYDLFVNSSYMSRVVPSSPHSVYVCYFPTPFDHDLATWQRYLSRRLGPLVAHDRRLGYEYGTGWYPPEGSRLRTWTWTSGAAVLAVAPGGRRRLVVDVGRPGAGPAELVVRSAGEVLVRIDVPGRGWRRHAIDLPPSEDGFELHFESPTFNPPLPDTRDLGVAISNLRLVGHNGSTFSVRARVTGRLPWLLRGADDLSFLDSYGTIVTISDFSLHWLRRFWGRDAEVLTPPIAVSGAPCADERRKAILTVGRFFAPGHGHCKRQLEMVQIFGSMVRAGRLPGWELHVVGGCEDSQRGYLERVRSAAEGLPVVLSVNSGRDRLAELFATSSIYWSATGFGEDPERAPWAMEHFGITTVEAMASGCVPVVIDRAGQREIVRDGVDGFRWLTRDELVARTLAVAEDEQLRARLAASSRERAHVYSEEAFARRWREIAAAAGIPRP
jgi:glycosyltransferase involved in cell wall biosynthesis